MEICCGVRISRCLLVLVFLTLLASWCPGGEAKKKKQCSLKMSQGTYVIVCSRARPARKAKEAPQRKKERGVSLPSRPEEILRKSYRKAEKTKTRKTKFSLQTRCMNDATIWIPRKGESPFPQVAVGCKGRQFLQAFAIESSDAGYRYNYTCCTWV